MVLYIGTHLVRIWCILISITFALTKCLGQHLSIDFYDACVKYFGESGGYVHLILASRDESLDFDIWKLKEITPGGL